VINKEEQGMRASLRVGAVIGAFSLISLPAVARFATADDVKPASAAEAVKTEGAKSEEPKPDQLPAEVDLRPELEKLGLGPRRQGRRNTCSVFTTAAAFEFALAKHRGEGEPFSVEYLNWACNQVIGNKTEDRGQFFHHLLRAFRQYGVCAESDMRYRRRFDPEFTPSDEAKKHAKEIGDQAFEVNWIKQIRPEGRLSDKQFQEIKQTLAKGFPVAAGAAHSRLFVGYKNDESKPGGGIFLTKDSGEGRFSEVTYEFAKRELNDAFWVEIAAAK
jgi:hypothetical protein